MTAKPGNKTGSKKKSSTPKKASAKKSASSKKSGAAKTAARKSSPKTALGDDPLKWMKDALGDDATAPAERNEPVPEVSQPAVATESELVEEDLVDDEPLPHSVIESIDEQAWEEDVTSDVDSAGGQTGSSIDLGPRLVISTVKEIKLEMDRVLELEGDIQLLADNVDDVDTAGIQLLFAFRMEAARHDRNLIFSSVPKKMREVAGIMNISESMFDTR
ncbi:MAG: STAS domain-containing protein [Gammaproteobacteria bacterium]|nr:STAS domain-containing protein [Gammaproteobacteria bacterium]